MKDEHLNRKIDAYRRSGTEDYLAARCLLLNRHPKAGSEIAHTAIEKIIKAIELELTGGCQKIGHDNVQRWQGLAESFDDLQRLLNVDFLEYLQAIYNLRYFEEKSNMMFCIASLQTLLALDKYFGQLSNFLSSRRSDTCPYRGYIDRDDDKLTRLNVFISLCDIEEFISQRDYFQFFLLPHHESTVSFVWGASYRNTVNPDDPTILNMLKDKAPEECIGEN